MVHTKKGEDDLTKKVLKELHQLFCSLGHHASISFQDFRTIYRNFRQAQQNFRSKTSKIQRSASRRLSFGNASRFRRNLW